MLDWCLVVSLSSNYQGPHPKLTFNVPLKQFYELYLERNARLFLLIALFKSCVECGGHKQTHFLYKHWPKNIVLRGHIHWMNTDFNNSKGILLRKDSLERHCGGCIYTCLFIGIPCSVALCRYYCFLFNKLKPRVEQVFWHHFSNSTLFEWSYIHFFFRHNATEHLIDYSIG